MKGFAEAGERLSCCTVQGSHIMAIPPEASAPGVCTGDAQARLRDPAGASGESGCIAGSAPLGWVDWGWLA